MDDSMKMSKVDYRYLATIKFENFHLRFIYRISYKIAIKANPPKWLCPIENYRYAIKAKMSDISKVFEAADIFIF
jgi:hypothetical protein